MAGRPRAAECVVRAQLCTWRYRMANIGADGGCAVHTRTHSDAEVAAPGG
jgi:hypothetical protein